MKADIVIITALDKEFHSVIKLGTDYYGLKWEVTHSPRTSRTYHLTKNKFGTRIALAKTFGMGQIKAAAITADILFDCHPSIILLVGIAAGTGDNINLGDIAISLRVIDFELGKLTDKGQNLEFPSFNCNPALVGELTEINDNIWMKKISHERPDLSKETIPMVHTGDVFCSNKVIADSRKAKGLKATFKKGIALEMESYGVAAILESRKVRPNFVMIKGICDKADAHKNDDWQYYASDIAASYTLNVLTSIDLSQFSTDNFHFSIKYLSSEILNSMLPTFKGVETFQYDVASNILNSSLQEATEILSGEYSVNMGYGGHYLSRAAPLFGYASKIFATSLDTISTFWTDTNNRDETIEYLKNQTPRGTGLAMRLFVFSSADSAHRYAIMLDKHTEAYKNVFICSRRSYLKMLNKISLGKSAEELSMFDFSILQYEHNDRTTSLHAKLSSKSLTYRIIDINEPKEINYGMFIEIMKKYSEMEQGQFILGDGIFRWQQGVWHDKDKWSGTLKAMFDERNADVFHIVTFYVDRNTEKHLQKECAKVKKDLLANDPNTGISLKNKYGIKEIRFGKQLKYQDFILDGEFKGRLALPNKNDDPYVLIMQFDNQDGLKNFYSDNKHSKIRRKIYEALDDRISQLYELAENDLSVQDDAPKKKLLYEAIESMASTYMKRKDYIDDEMILEMVLTTDPYQF